MMTHDRSPRARREVAVSLPGPVSVLHVDNEVAETDRLTWARETIAHLDLLPHDQLQALRLVYRDGLLLSEAAVRVNVSLTEFARRVSAGLQSLGQRPHSAIG